MTNQAPTAPEAQHGLPGEPDRSFPPNPHAPSGVDGGFPTGAVETLRQYNRTGEVEDGLDKALDAVLAWIDRYVPQSLVGSEETVVVDGIRELRFEGDDALLDMLDLVRVNGRPFVPETPTIVEDDVEICDACNGSGFGAGDGFCGRCGGSGGLPATRPIDGPTPPVNHEAANRQRAGMCDTLAARAARESFGEHPDPIHRGGGRTSIHRSHRAEGGPNFVD